MKYKFNKANTTQDIIEALGLKVNPTEVTIRRPSIDDEGNISDMEIDFGKTILSTVEERKLDELMNKQGLKLGGKQ